MGSQRKELIRFLQDEQFTGEVLRKKINERGTLKLSLREISRHLTSFAEKELLICLNPKAPYNRLYILTKKGKEIRKRFVAQ